MKGWLAILLVIVLIITPFIFFKNENLFQNFTGKLSQSFGGPSEGDQECMLACVSIGCNPGDQACMMTNSENCLDECGIEGEPEPENEGEACMQECIKKGCGKIDFACREGNGDSCEEECNMKGDAPDESEMSGEQICISECVAEVDPEMRCQNSQEGETGGRVCKKCAKNCEYLYAGPCFDDKEIKTKQKECETCKHCYGEPVMGDSGEGWECIVDIECKDASSEFGDMSGEGPGIGQEGFVAKIGNSIGGFFRNLFGGRNNDKIIGGEESSGIAEESGSENSIINSVE